jgi:hypothetical protein
MSITKTLLAGVAGTVLASGMADAGEPVKLSTAELDQVTAGFFQSTVEGLPSFLQGLTGSFEQTAFVNGRETTSVYSPTNFSSKVATNAVGTSEGQGTGGLFSIGGEVGLAEGQFIFGGMFAESVVIGTLPF